jgi:TatA/E family protein of Tat protein translocase
MNIGVQEMLFIFVLALLIFGPKKLPELGRSLGRGLSEFRRASAELKGSLEREMQNLDQETRYVEQETRHEEQETRHEEQEARHEEQEIRHEEMQAAADTPAEPPQTTDDHGYQDYSHTEHTD